MTNKPDELIRGYLARLWKSESRETESGTIINKEGAELNKKKKRKTKKEKAETKNKLKYFEGKTKMI